MLHPALAARYLGAVAAVAPSVEAGLSDAVVANRVARACVDPPVLRLRPFRGERAAFRRRLVALAAHSPCLLFADVRSCFPSIAAEAVERALRALGCPGEPVADVVAVLRRLSGLGVRGLPVGPDASAVLANAVLAEADRALEPAPFLRWVDDLVVGVAGRGQAVQALGSLRAALARAGLELNAAKTRVLTAADPLIAVPSLGRAVPERTIAPWASPRVG